MAKFKRISFLIIILAVVFCAAVPQRNLKLLAAKKIRHLKQRPIVLQKRVLARQESVTPYPAADELRPEIPFEEGNIPDEVYGPPDQTYGPPEIDLTPADQLPSEEAPREFAPNPDAEEFQNTEEKIVSPLKAHILRLTRGKKSIKKNLSAHLLQKKRQRLIASSVQAIANPSALPVNMPLSSYTQYLFSNQPLVYTANYQSW
ncbi:hypothetical protein EVAR_68347_1 [Eumeta japonica]|uniref:DUF4794 domain-containing protein n=1 Tax=Eumeta variegata TaxID=151549 RepID=A0A4C1SEF5_EUMVA|nr:hypothetical protein EVAR_68347_1 [Eumeta japonica]